MLGSTRKLFSVILEVLKKHKNVPLTICALKKKLAIFLQQAFKEFGKENFMLIFLEAVASEGAKRSSTHLHPSPPIALGKKRAANCPEGAGCTANSQGGQA